MGQNPFFKKEYFFSHNAYIRAIEPFQNHLIILGAKPCQGSAPQICNYLWTIDYSGNILHHDTLNHVLSLPEVLPAHHFEPFGYNLMFYTEGAVYIDSLNINIWSPTMLVTDTAGIFIDSVKIILNTNYHLTRLLPPIYKFTDSSFVGVGAEFSNLPLSSQHYLNDYLIEVGMDGFEIQRKILGLKASSGTIVPFTSKPVASGKLFATGYTLNANPNFITYHLYDSLFKSTQHQEWQINQTNGPSNCQQVPYDGGYLNKIEEDFQGNLYGVRSTQLPHHNTSAPDLVILGLVKIDPTSGSCLWHKEFGVKRQIAYGMDLKYLPEDSTLIFCGTGTEIDSLGPSGEPITFIPYIPTLIGKIDTKTDSVLWTRIIVEEDYQTYEQYIPLEITNHGENIIVGVNKQLSNGTDSNPYILYLNCDGFDSLPKANFYSWAELNNKVKFHNSSENASKFYWDFGDGSFSSEAFPSHQYSSSGMYSVKLIVESCSRTDTIIQTVEAKPVGIEEPSVILKAYPNPVQDFLTVNFLDDQGKMGVTLYDIAGVPVLSIPKDSGKKTIDVSFLPSGVYFLRPTNIQTAYKAIKILKIE